MSEEYKCNDCKRQCSFLFQEEIDCSNNGYPLFEPSEEYEIKQLKKQLNEAKDLIRNLLRVTYGEGWNYSLDWKVKAEEFLREVEKCLGD